MAGLTNLMRDMLNEPKGWRNRAIEARAIAEQMKDPQARDIMFRIADDYDRLAERAQNGGVV